MTLPALLAELDSAPNGCLDDVRRQLRVVVVAVMEMREAVEDNARIADFFQRDNCVRSMAGQVDLIARLTRERDTAERAREEFATMWNAELRKNDEARADVARLTEERDAAEQTALDVGMRRQMTEDRATRIAVERDIAMRERDAMRAAMLMMERLRDECVDEVATRTTERDAARDINAQLRREIGDCLTVDMLIKERDAARETVAAEIAAWLEEEAYTRVSYATGVGVSRAFVEIVATVLAAAIRNCNWRKEPK